MLLDECNQKHAVLMTDMRNKMDELAEQANTTNLAVARIEENLNFLRKAIEGNGKPGIMGRLAEVESRLDQMDGASGYKRWALPIIIAVLCSVISVMVSIWSTQYKASTSTSSVTATTETTTHQVK